MRDEPDFLEFNRQRWNALVRAGVVWSRPRLDLDEAGARQLIHYQDFLSDLRGKNVLCLASGGGQQSAAFAVLGANVTVLDLSDEQLAADRLAAQHYQAAIRTEQGDMRDLIATIIVHLVFNAPVAAASILFELAKP